MRVVLYANDMIPLTVIDLREHECRHLMRYGRVSLSVPLPLDYNSVSDLYKFGPACEVVDLTCKSFSLNGRDQHMIVFCADEHTAMQMRAAFLPGQMSERAILEQLRSRKRVD